MSTNTHIPPGSVVVGVDGSAHAERAVAWAADHAERHHRPLALVHAEDPFSTANGVWLSSAGIDPVTLRREIEEAGAALLERTAASTREGHPLLQVVTAYRPSDPRQALITASAEAATVVVGSRGRGPLASLLLGSVSTAVVKHAACPVAVVPPERDTRPAPSRGGVLAGIDCRAAEHAVLETAYAEAAARKVPLTVLHCYWDALGIARTTRRVPDDDPTVEDLRRLVAEATAGMAERHPDVEVHLELARGSAEGLLTHETADHDLVVVGHRRSRSLSALLHGSVAMTVVELASCPVLVVPLDTHARPDR